MVAKSPSPHTPAGISHPPRHLEVLKERWADYQRRNGLKTTSQRELIVGTFLDSSEHVSIDDLLVLVRAHNQRVGYATVYRTMKLLAAAGLAASRQFGDGQTRYEVAGPETPHHDHLICLQCGLILEFENREIERLQDKVADKLGGFRIVQHKLELYGLCPKAQNIPSGLCPNENRDALVGMTVAQHGHSHGPKKPPRRTPPSRD